MAIKVTILDSPSEEEETEPSITLKVHVNDKEIKKVSLKAQRSIDGNIIIRDHPEILVFIMPKASKVVAVAKDELDEELHDTQERLFKHLVQDGVISYDSVQAGNIFMSMEGKIPEPTTEGSKIEYVLYSLSKFFKKEMPFYADQKDFEKEEAERLLEPEPDEFTEFDPNRHEENKGSLAPNMISTGISTIYRL